MIRFRPILAIIAILALALPVFPIAATAQHDAGMGTPGANHPHDISNGAIYMTIANTGDEGDRLVSATSDVSASAEVHNNVMEGGVVKMVPQHDGVEIPAGGKLVMEPGGYHIMLVDISRSLLAGDEFSATLTFERAGDVEVRVPVVAGQPEPGELAAEPVEAGDIVIAGIWARQAPKLDRSATMGDQAATPVASPITGTPVAVTDDGGPVDHDHDHGDGEHQGLSMGAFYMTITNNGDEADRLVSVTTDVAETVEIHNVVMDGGVMQMVPQVDGVEVPAGGGLVLEPSGHHAMLVGLTESLLDGDTFTATLTFENAGDIEITVPVFMSEPDADELTADPVEAGDLVIDGVWARQAPKIESGATPEGTPGS